MKKNILNTTARLLLAGGLVVSAASLTSCEDFLTILPTNQIPEENFWEDKNDLEGVRAGAYQKMTQSGITGRILYWGEFRGDNLELNKMENTAIMYMQDGVLQPTNGMFSWADFYAGINYCNLVLEKGQQMVDNGTDPSFGVSDWRPVKAEMLALRALYYFYLVRAYRDVPFVTAAVHTDEEALKSRIAATSGAEILESLINDLEGCYPTAQNAYSTLRDTKGRFTRNSIRTLLADMYLWRGCMLKVSNSAAAKECFNKAYEHSSAVLAYMKAEYDKDIKNNPNASAEEKTQAYPLIRIEPSTNSVYDAPYTQIFGNKNSDESLFEVQYSQSDNSLNSSISSYLGVYENNELKAGIMTVASSLLNSTIVNPDVGFGKTDFRMVETAHVRYTETRKPMMKNIATNLTIQNMEDVTEGYSYSCRNSSEQYGNWPVYRLTDLMLIRAEAYARYKLLTDAEKTGNDDAKLTEAFASVNAIFERSNPKCVGTDAPGDVEPQFQVERLNAEYAKDKNASQLLDLVYRERQREFVGEGKRWFDIVRQAEYSGDFKTTLVNYGSFKSSVTNRLTSIHAFYCPIYSEELKVNGVEYGGGLVQNPVWDKYSKK